MPRHAKNNVSGAVFTAHERSQLKYGTQVERLGGDSIKAFDSCSLCLHQVIEPMCCRKGHLFCKSCIFEYLLSQKTEIAKQIARFEEQEKKRLSDFESKQEQLRNQHVKEFDKANDVLPTTFVSSISHSSNSAFTGSSAVVLYKEEKGGDSGTVEKKKDQAPFWVQIPEAPQESLVKPSAETNCPEGKHVLRVKQLIPVEFCPNKGDDKKDNKYQCWVCVKTLTGSTPVVVLKGCHHAICSACMTRNKKESTCPNCSQKYSEKEIIKLNSGGTGYAGNMGDKLNATKFTPTAWL